MVFKFNQTHKQLFAFERIVRAWSTAPKLALSLGVGANANIFIRTLFFLVSYLVGVLSVLVDITLSVVLKGRKGALTGFP